MPTPTLPSAAGAAAPDCAQRQVVGIAGPGLSITRVPSGIQKMQSAGRGIRRRSDLHIRTCHNDPHATGAVSLLVMHPYPHVYSATGRATASGNVDTTVEGLPALPVAPPIQFDGPGYVWSPETMLTAAVADCLILTFRSISRASGLAWQQLECQTEGVLERVGGVSRFTRFITHATLTLPVSANRELARRVLEKSESGCIVSNSLNAKRELKVELKTAGAVADCQPRASA